MRAARNESVGFQVLLRARRGDLERITCEVSDLRPASKGAEPISRDNIELLREWYVQVATPSLTNNIPGLGPGEYPDPLVPLSAAKGGAPFSLRNGARETLFVDIHVPPATVPGQYRGTLAIRADGKPAGFLTLNLKVWRFTLPEQTHFQNTFAYSPEFLRWGFRNPPQADLLQIEDNLQQTAQRHRMNVVSDTQGRKTSEQWRAWDDRYGKYLDGSAFTGSPGKGVGRYGWRIGFDVAQDDQSLRRDIEAAAAHLRQKGWLDHFFTTGFDEPKPDKYPLVRKLGLQVRQATGGQLKHFLPGAAPNEAFQGYVDIWDGVWTQKDLPVLADRREAGQRIWYCGGLGAPANPVIDSIAYGARAWAWVAWKYGFEGFEMWHAIYWADKFNQPDQERKQFLADLDREPGPLLNVWKNPAPLTFDEGRKRGHAEKGDIRQNGGAVFFYPGYDVGLPKEVVSCLRAKDFRRGAQDYEYLWLLQQAGEDKLIEKAVSRIYVPEAITMVRGGSPKVPTGDLGVPTDEKTWEAVRLMLGERLDELASKR